MSPKLVHPKSGIPTLLNATYEENYLGWKKRFLVYLASRPLPANYYRVVDLRTQLLHGVKKPEVKDETNPTLEEIKDIIAYNAAENEIIKVVYEHIDEGLQTKFDSHKDQGSVCQQWAMFKKDLKYDADHQSRVLVERFNTLKQDPKEDPLTYALRIEQLVNQTKVINKSITDSVAFNRFTDSLIPYVLMNEPLLISFHQQGISTLSGALAELKRMEARRSIARLVHGTVPDLASGVAFSTAIKTDNRKPPPSNTVTTTINPNCRCKRGINCPQAQKGRLCAQCNKCLYYGHLMVHCTDRLIQACRKTQGPTPPPNSDKSAFTPAMENSGKAMMAGSPSSKVTFTVGTETFDDGDLLLENKEDSFDEAFYSFAPTSSFCSSTGTCFSATSVTSNSVQIGLADSGASGSLFHTIPSWAINHRTGPSNSYQTASNHCLQTTGQLADLPLSPDFTLQGIEHTPGISANLISIWKILSQGEDVWFNYKDFTVNVGTLGTPHSTKLTGCGKNGLFFFEMPPASIPPVSNTAYLASTYTRNPVNPIQRLHDRLLHTNYHLIKEKLQSGVTRGIPKNITFDPNRQYCEPCVFGKMHIQPLETHAMTS
ncbi:hypothetical protein HDU67_010110 [Dinochytrium kinnereticum]|nr:hypothetical protein HDU67_010110 [Dinochytrium kinnereticum]